MYLDSCMDSIVVQREPCPPFLHTHTLPRQINGAYESFSICSPFEEDLNAWLSKTATKLRTLRVSTLTPRTNRRSTSRHS